MANGQGLYFGRPAAPWKDRWLEGWRDGHNTNWENLMYNSDAGQKQAQLSVSGGNSRTKFFFSGGYSDQTAIIILNDFELKRFRNISKN